MWLSHAALQIGHLQNEHFGEGWRLNKNNITCNGLNQAHGKHSVSVNYCWNKERQRALMKGYVPVWVFVPLFMSGAVRKLERTWADSGWSFSFTAANLVVISQWASVYTPAWKWKGWTHSYLVRTAQGCVLAPRVTRSLGLHQGVQVIRPYLINWGERRVRWQKSLSEFEWKS